MHEYTIDSGERRSITITLALLGVPAAYVLAWVLDAAGLSSLWWLDVPAAVGFGGLFYTVFDRWVWCWKPLSRLGIVRTPDLRGRWRGEIKSLNAPHSAPTTAEFRVEQTWTRMCISMTGPQSRSKSVVAAITVDTPEPELVYTYHNIPNADAVATMEQHFGTASHRLTDEGRRLNGEYFTGRGRTTYGIVTLQRAD